NVTTGKNERIGRILQMHANSREEREDIGAGDIAAMVALKNTSTGDTLAIDTAPTRLEAMDLPDPVISVAIEPTTKGDHDTLDAYEFLDKIVGGKVPGEYISSVDLGILEAMEAGILAGYPVVDVRVDLVDGSYHDVDSSEMAFKVAGSMAFKTAMQRAKPKLLEPVMAVEVVTPEDYLGDVMGDLNSRRGHIEHLEPRGNAQAIR